MMLVLTFYLETMERLGFQKNNSDFFYWLFRTFFSNEILLIFEQFIVYLIFFRLVEAKPKIFHEELPPILLESVAVDSAASSQGLKIT